MNSYCSVAVRILDAGLKHYRLENYHRHRWAMHHVTRVMLTRRSPSRRLWDLGAHVYLARASAARADASVVVVSFAPVAVLRGSDRALGELGRQRTVAESGMHRHS